MPVPETRPSDAAKAASPTSRASRKDRPSIGRHNTRRTRPAPASAEVRADAACRDRLKELGVIFESQQPLDDAQGCSVPFPLSISRLPAGIRVEPPAVLNCAMAEAAARFARDTISPAAQSVHGSTLETIGGVSGYTCRPRNGSTKLSEHAFGNALDISRFVLADGTAIDVGAPGADAKAREFLAKIRAAACGPFKTVLGPGSDADHASHFHFDLAARRGGATFCQ